VRVTRPISTILSRKNSPGSSSTSLEAILAAAEVEACAALAQQALDRWVMAGESGQK